MSSAWCRTVGVMFGVIWCHVCLVFGVILWCYCRVLCGVATTEEKNAASKKRESCIISAANMRVLGVLKHWIAKHSQVLNPPSDYSQTSLLCCFSEIFEPFIRRP